MIVWNLQEKYQEFVFKEFISYVLSVSITDDNKYVISGGGDCDIRILNLLEKHQETVLKGHKSCVTSLKITHDNKFIVSGSTDY